ncbi:MAG: signal peptidase II [Chloroflexi bacterium]|nr:signal peptidase II [Chloroflexota bacterium]
MSEFVLRVKSKQLIWPLLLAASIIISDQITKAFIVEWLKPQGTVSIIGDLLRLTYVTNSGVAFGMLTGMPYVLTVPIVILIGVIAFYLVKTLGQSFLLTLALSLELGGALGNLIDRIRLGYVVDFVKLPYWPAFNVADSCVVIGAIGLAFVLLWQDRQPRSEEPDSSLS